MACALTTASVRAQGSDALSDSEAQFVLGNTLWTLVHEMAHAMIAELDINVLGQEEDAADRIASVALLHGTGDHNHGEAELNRLADAAEAWRLEWILDQHEGETAPYWDSHPLDIQRYYNIICLIHAHDPQVLAKRPKLHLPGQRALSCDDYEYEQAAKSVQKVVELYGRQADEIGQPISIRYEAPTNDRHAPLAALVEGAGIAEHVASQTQKLFAMPDAIQIVFGSCLGDVSAFWRNDLKEIVICYDLLDRFLYLHQVRSCLGEQEESVETISACTSPTR